eukprot:5334859-Pleurochrysis_carterae.AAC.1
MAITNRNFTARCASAVPPRLASSAAACRIPPPLRVPFSPRALPCWLARPTTFRHFGGFSPIGASASLFFV